MVEEVTPPKWWINVPAKVASISCKKLGSTHKLIFGEIYSMLNAVDSFYMTNKPLGERVGMSERQASRSISKLKEFGLINVNVTYKNNVPKRVISVNQGSPYLSTPPSQICRTPHDKSGDIENNREDNKRTSGSNEQDKSLDKKYKDEACKTIDYLNEHAHKHFKHSKTSMRPIIARLRDDHLTSKKVKHIIDVKVYDWLNSEKMNKFLNPKTLFRASNYEYYLNQPLPSQSIQGRTEAKRPKYKPSSEVDKEREAEDDEVEEELEKKLKEGKI